MQEKSFTKIKKQNPVSVIVHSTNALGANLAKILLEQGSKVILVDKFDSKSKDLISDLKKKGEVDFVDIGGLEDLMQNIERVDYLFYLQSEFLLKNDSFTSKDFLEESNNLNLCLKVAHKYSSKFSLVSSIYLNEKLTHMQDSQPTSYSPEELQKYSETLTAEYHDKSKINVRILRAGIILGKESNIENFKTLNKLFEDSIKNDAIEIAGEGLDIHYLVHLSDLIYGILRLTFSTETNGEVVSLCNNNEYSTLSIAYKLLELNPYATEIKFVPNPEKRPVLHSQYIPAPNAEEYGWKQKKSLENSFAETLEVEYEKNNKKWTKPTLSEISYKEKLEEIRTKKTSSFKNKGKKQGHTSLVATPTGEAVSKTLKMFKGISIKEKLKSKDFLKTSLLLLLLLPLFYFLIYPLFSITTNGILAYRKTTKISENITSFESDFANNFTGLNRNIQNINKSFKNLNWLFLITQNSDTYDETLVLLHGLETSSEGLSALSEGIQPLITYLDDFEPALGFEGGPPTTTREYTNILRDLEKNSDQISESSHKVSQGLKAIGEVNSEIYPNFIQERLEKIQETIIPMQDDFADIAQIVQFLPDSLGVDGRKRYLILLQNPGELRSTGGWISSYAIIGIEGGQIRELKVDDVYNLDGELKNQQKFFEPPTDMAEALGIKLFTPSLLNWDPNFPSVAKEAKSFMREAGEAANISGVIAIDIYLFQDLLEQWGGINIPGERDLITSDNIYEKVFFLHENFTPGESQKATFLTNLADEVIKRIFSSNFGENSQVLTIFKNSLERKNMLIHFDDVNAQKYFSSRGWAGEISPQRHSFIPSAVEWNWGANKANLYLEREQRIQADILNLDNVEYRYSLILKNNSTSETYPQGKYKNYLRLYIPEKANVSEATGFEEDEYTISYKKGFKVLEGWFNIPVSSTKELKVDYTLENTKDLIKTRGNEIFLNSKVFKQPGTSKEDSIRIDIIYPQNWAIVEQGNFERTRVNLIKQTKLNSEKSIDLVWERQ